MQAIIILLTLVLSFGQARAETLTVKFQPTDPGDRVSGNLIVVLSKTPFPPSGAGLLRVYAGEVRCLPNQTLGQGQTLTLELKSGQRPLYAGAFLDQNRNFMASALAEPGEYYSSQVVALKGKDASLSLDRKRQPRVVKPPAWLQEHLIVSPLMLRAGFSVQQATQRFLVGLPPGYWTSGKRYPLLFVSHGFSGSRWANLDCYRIWREEMKLRPMILVSLESNGDYGHHLFLNSEANGPRMRVLTEEVVPYIERRYRSQGQRVVYGQSSGGWTAISLLRRAPPVFAGAVATGPDPLTLQDWWMGPNQNLFTQPDGSPRMFAESIGLTMRTLVDREVDTRSFGQFAAFLACFSRARPEQEPMPFQSPFDLVSGAFQPQVWADWQDNDQSLWVQAHPDQARQNFANRLALFVGNRDEFGLYPTTLRFSHTLDRLKIPHRLRVIEGAGHTDYLDRPDFQRELYRTCFELSRSSLVESSAWEPATVSR